MVQLHSKSYAFLKPWVLAGSNLFFKEFQIYHTERIPKDAGFILVANHQNAMLDPVMCCIRMDRQLHWLTRADVFKKSAVNTFLRGLNMLPVYRERDRVGDMAAKNDEIFSIAYERLRHGAVVALFPEGTHRGKKQLNTPLKKGIARVAMGTQAKQLYILPVGLEYSDFYHSRGELAIVCGEPIDVAPFAEQYASDPNRTMTQLVNVVQTELSKVMIDITKNDRYDALDHLREMCFSSSNDQSLLARFNRYKAWTLQMDNHIHWSAIQEDALAYTATCQKYRLHESGLNTDNAAQATASAILLGALGLPALLVFYPLHSITENFISKKIKDPLFFNSIRLSFWTFLTPFWLLMGAGLFGLLTQSLMVFAGSLFGLLISGFFAIRATDAWKLRQKIRHAKKVLQSSQFDIHAFVQQRERLKRHFENFNS